MVYRGRGRPNPRSRGFGRPPRSRGRGRRPFVHRGHFRGGFEHGDEGLRITLRNTGFDRHGDDRPPPDHGSDRRDDYDSYRDDFEQERGLGLESPARFDRIDDDCRETPRTREHLDSDFMEDESLRITVGNDIYEEERRDMAHSSDWDPQRRDSFDRWTHEDRMEQHYNRRGSRDYRDGSYDEEREEWENTRPGTSGIKRGRGRGCFHEGYDPSHRERGRGGFRGRDQGSYEPHERDRGSHGGYSKNFGGDRGHGDRHSFNADFDGNGQRKKSFHHEGRQSGNRDRQSRSPGRRHSRSPGRRHSRSPGRRHSRSPGRRHSRSRSFGREQSDSRDRRSYKHRQGQQSHSRERQSFNTRRQGQIHGRRDSRHRDSHSRSRSNSDSRHSSSRSYSRGRSPGMRRRYSQSPEQSKIDLPTKHETIGKKAERIMASGNDRDSSNSPHHQSSSSSSSSTINSRSHGSLPDMSEQQYEEEMYRRLKSEIDANKHPKDREESIAKHIREMAKVSPLLFRQFMAKNANNLSGMASKEPPRDQEQDTDAETVQDEFESYDSKPLRSILKRKADSRSQSVDKNPSPPEQPRALSQIEKVIQALRKGGSKQEEQKSELPRENTPPPPRGALRQLSSYMDIDDEEEFLYGDGAEVKPETATPAEPFWSANQFEDRQQTALYSLYEEAGEHASAPQKKEDIKVPSSFSTFEEKEKSYEQWRASLFNNPEKAKETPPPPSSDVKGNESAEQISSTVANILKSIGFNFELSQRMQELARQKKEEEQEAIKINQNASFLGTDSDSLAEDLTSILQKNKESPQPLYDEFMQEVEASTKAAREKAQKFKEEAFLRVRGNDYPRFQDIREGSKGEMPKRSGKSSPVSYSSQISVHSDVSYPPYDPSSQAYYNAFLSKQKFGEYELGGARGHEMSGSFSENPHRPESIRSSNLIALGGGGESSDLVHGSVLSKNFSDLQHFVRHDRDAEDFNYKKPGERILTKKQDEKNRSDNPDCESDLFSRRIVLPPKEKSKISRGRSPVSNSQRDGKRRAASPDSPRQAKLSRRSPHAEDLMISRKSFQRSKSPKERDYVKSENYYREREKTSSLDDCKTKMEPQTKTSSLQDALSEARDKLYSIQRNKKLYALEKELSALHKQHNELLRKRRRQKDSHKDPLIIENVKLQTEIASQIKMLREGKDISVSDTVSLEKTKSSVAESSSSNTDSRTKEVKLKETKISYEYFDPGSHWCSTCNIVCGHMFDFFKHVESKKHQQKLDPFNRPWLVEAMQKQEKKSKPQGPVQAAPIKGLEFMMSTAAFYCSLCSEFCGDLSIAETHMKSEKHHEKYKDYLTQHPYYEKRLMLERSAALSTQKVLSPEDIDSDSHHSDNSKKKPATKSESDRMTSSKDKNEGWHDKVNDSKSLYADREEGKKRSDTRDKYRDKYRDRSRSRDRHGSSRNRRDSRDRDHKDRESRDSKNSKDRNDRSKSIDSKNREMSDKKDPSKTKEMSSADKNAKTAVKTDKTVDVRKSETEKMSAENSAKEQVKQGGDQGMVLKVENKEDEDKKDKGTKKDGNGKKEGDTEVKGKIPIKLTGKTGIKPVSTAPPWKVGLLTRAIPKSTTQKRLLTTKPQASVPKPSPTLPNDEPIPLEDFLTVGVQKSVPIVPELPNIPVPPLPKPKFEKVKEEIKLTNKEELDEMQILGIDPLSLVPDIKPKPPPPPSQNLNLPPADNTSASAEAGTELKQGNKTDNGSRQVEKESLNSSTDNPEGPESCAGTSSTAQSVQDPADSGRNTNYEIKKEMVKPLVLPSEEVKPPSPRVSSHEELLVSCPPQPSLAPVSSAVPCDQPSLAPVSATPCDQPSLAPVSSAAPCNQPSLAPVSSTAPCDQPSTAAVPSSSQPISLHRVTIPTDSIAAAISSVPSPPGKIYVVPPACAGLPPQPEIVSSNPETQLHVNVPIVDESISSTVKPLSCILPQPETVLPMASMPMFIEQGENVAPKQDTLSESRITVSSTGHVPDLFDVSIPLSESTVSPSVSHITSGSVLTVSSSVPAPESVGANSEALPPQQEQLPAPDAAPDYVSAFTGANTASLDSTALQRDASSPPHAEPGPCSHISFTACVSTLSPAVVGVSSPLFPSQGSPLRVHSGSVAGAQSSAVSESVNPATQLTVEPVASMDTMTISTESFSEGGDSENALQSQIIVMSAATEMLSTVATSSTLVPSAIRMETASAENAMVTMSTEASASESMASLSASVSLSNPECSSEEPFASDIVAQSSDFAEATNTLAPTLPVKRAAARRGRGTRKASPAPQLSVDDSTVSEMSHVSSVAASRRPRTRSQLKPQPQRQTRSRTRQQKNEEEDENVSASDEIDNKSQAEVGSSTVQEAESAPFDIETASQEADMGDGNKASSTSACVLDLTNPLADSSWSETNTEVTSSSNAVKACTVIDSPTSGESALNLTVPPEVRESRQGLAVEQTMPEDLSSYAQPQDLSTSSSNKAGRCPPEMPIDLTMRLAPTQQSMGPSMSEVPHPMEVEPSPSAGSLEPQTVKDTLLSCTSAMNPSTSTLSELEVGVEEGTMDDAAPQAGDSAGLGVDPEGELVDFSLAPVDFEELVDMEVEESVAVQPDVVALEECEDATHSTFGTE